MTFTIPKEKLASILNTYKISRSGLIWQSPVRPEITRLYTAVKNIVDGKNQSAQALTINLEADFHLYFSDYFKSLKYTGLEPRDHFMFGILGQGDAVYTNILISLFYKQDTPFTVKHYQDIFSDPNKAQLLKTLSEINYTRNAELLMSNAAELNNIFSKLERQTFSGTVLEPHNFNTLKQNLLFYLNQAYDGLSQDGLADILNGMACKTGYIESIFQTSKTHYPVGIQAKNIRIFLKETNTLPRSINESTVENQGYLRSVAKKLQTHINSHPRLQDSDWVILRADVAHDFLQKFLSNFDRGTTKTACYLLAGEDADFRTALFNTREVFKATPACYDTLRNLPNDQNRKNLFNSIAALRESLPEADPRRNNAFYDVVKQMFPYIGENHMMTAVSLVKTLAQVLQNKSLSSSGKKVIASALVIVLKTEAKALNLQAAFALFSDSSDKNGKNKITPDQFETLCRQPAALTKGFISLIVQAKKTALNEPIFIQQDTEENREKVKFTLDVLSSKNSLKKNALEVLHNKDRLTLESYNTIVNMINIADFQVVITSLNASKDQDQQSLLTDERLDLILEHPETAAVLYRHAINKVNSCKKGALKLQSACEKVDALVSCVVPTPLESGRSNEIKTLIKAVDVHIAGSTYTHVMSQKASGSLLGAQPPISDADKGTVTNTQEAIKPWYQGSNFNL